MLETFHADAGTNKLMRQGAVLVPDPFAGSRFAELATPLKGMPYDPRGEEFVAYDMERYLAGFGSAAPIHSLATLRQVTGVDPFGPQGPIGYLHELAIFPSLLADYHEPPDMTAFLDARETFTGFASTAGNPFEIQNGRSLQGGRHGVYLRWYDFPLFDLMYVTTYVRFLSGERFTPPFGSAFAARFLGPGGND